MRRAALLLVVPLLAACGGAAQPKLEHADAAGLIALTDRIASESACAQSRDIPKLRARAVALVNARRVPAALQEPLLSGVNALATQQPLCLQSVPAASTTTTAVVTPSPRRPAPPRPHPHPHHPHGPPHHHGHGHGR